MYGLLVAIFFGLVFLFFAIYGLEKNRAGIYGFSVTISIVGSLAILIYFM